MSRSRRAPWVPGAVPEPGIRVRPFAVAKNAGASPRTIDPCLLRALRLPAAGEAVPNVALELWYASPSAFTVVFRRACGTTPSRYFRT